MKSLALLLIASLTISLFFIILPRDARSADEATPDQHVVRFLRGELAPQKGTAEPNQTTPASQQENDQAAQAHEEDEAAQAATDQVKEVSPGLAVLEGEELPTKPPVEAKPKPPAEAGLFFGPLPTRNQHPLYLLFFNFTSERACTLPPGKTEFAFRFDAANTLVKSEEGAALIDIDLESWVYKLEYRWGTPAGEFTVLLPVQDNTHGMMDNIITTWHGWFGLPQGDRADYPDNDFRYFVRTRNGTVFNFPSDKPGLGDISLQWKRELGASTDKQAWAARAAVKFPTGKSEHGLGSGKFDAGVGLAYERLSTRWARYANLNYILIGGSDFAGLDTRSVVSGMIGTEYRLKPNWWLTGQIDFCQSPLSTGSPWVDRDSVGLALGFHKRLSDHWIFSGGFSEDIRVDTVPDFAVIGELRWRF